MSCYGYPKATSPNIDRFAAGGTLFENTYSAYIPTTSAYTAMLTGMDLFTTQVVGLRHKGEIAPGVQTMAEILEKYGYTTSSIGYEGNPGARGFQRYQSFHAWGSWDEGRLTKAENLNQLALPELERLSEQEKPFFLFLRHMDPHAPYLPPAPYERMFYQGDECDPANESMKPVLSFKPFRDFLASWMPPGITDKDYVIAQYDGEVAYMDACIQVLFEKMQDLGIYDETLVILNADHGETLYDHDCFFDHHGLYEPTLHVPLVIRYPGRVPAGKRVKGYNQHQDLLPTLLELIGINPEIPFDGKSLAPMLKDEVTAHPSEFYITECTWMRKHGWRTPEWKLIQALEPDFHFKPAVELYHLVDDPLENNNLAEKKPEVVRMLEKRLQEHISRRERDSGKTNPIMTQGDWHGIPGVGSFKTSQQAYDSLYIGSAAQAKKLQEEKR